MTMSRSERIMTAAAAAATAALIAGFIWLIFRNMSGDIEPERFAVYSIALSSILSAVVIIYAALMMRSGESSAARYGRYAEERRKKESRSSRGCLPGVISAHTDPAPVAFSIHSLAFSGFLDTPIPSR